MESKTLKKLEIPHLSDDNKESDLILSPSKSPGRRRRLSVINRRLTLSPGYIKRNSVGQYSIPGSHVYEKYIILALYVKNTYDSDVLLNSNYFIRMCILADLAICDAIKLDVCDETPTEKLHNMKIIVKPNIYLGDKVLDPILLLLREKRYSVKQYMEGSKGSIMNIFKSGFNDDGATSLKLAIVDKLVNESLIYFHTNENLTSKKLNNSLSREKKLLYRFVTDKEITASIVESIVSVIVTPLGEPYPNIESVLLACICIHSRLSHKLMLNSTVLYHPYHSTIERHRDIILQYAFNPDILDMIKVSYVLRSLLYAIGHKELKNLI